MEANELRLKNWAIHPASGTEIQLTETDIIQIMERIQDGLNQNYEPIPLTTEWLERAGFVKEFDDVYSIGLPTGDGVDLLLEWGDCCLRRNHVGKEKKEGDKNPYDYAYIKSPKYVHQLQQLYFSLSGKELEFK